MRLLKTEEINSIEIEVTEKGFNIFIIDKNEFDNSSEKVCLINAKDFKESGIISYGNADFSRFEALINEEQMHIQFVKL